MFVQLSRSYKSCVYVVILLRDANNSEDDGKTANVNLQAYQ